MPEVAAGQSWVGLPTFSEGFTSAGMAFAKNQVGSAKYELAGTFGECLALTL
jgi:hypothetical protein